MKCYRFINETHIEPYDKKYVIVNGKQISHPSAETLLEADIKPCRELPEPLYDENTQTTEYYYEDGETEIVKRWRVIDVEVIDDDEIADA